MQRRRQASGIIAICFVTLCSALADSAAQSVSSTKQGKNEIAIRSVLQQWVDALRKGDMVALHQILPEDYRITVADGRVLNREEDLEPIAKKAFTFSSAAVDSVEVRVFGDDAAVVTGIGIFTVAMGEKSMAVRERFTDVYVKRKGKWQPVAGHSTQLKTPSTSGSR